MIRAHFCVCDAITTIVLLRGVSVRRRVMSLTQTKAALSFVNEFLCWPFWKTLHWFVISEHLGNHAHRQQLCGEQGSGFGDAQTSCVQCSRSQPYVIKYSSRRWSTWSKSNHTAPHRMLNCKRKSRVLHMTWEGGWDYKQTIFNACGLGTWPHHTTPHTLHHIYIYIYIHTTQHRFGPKPGPPKKTLQDPS